MSSEVMTIKKTTYRSIQSPEHPLEKIGAVDAAAYLNADSRNAIVIVDLEDDDGVLATGHNLAVWRGAAGTIENFYYQELPPGDHSDPGDASGGDLSAAMAIAAAIEMIYS